KQVQGDEKQSALLEKITRQTFRASEIVNSLLNFSRTSSAEFTNVDLNRVIQDTLTLLDHQFKTARIRVQPDLQAELPPIYGNTGTGIAQEHIHRIYDPFFTTKNKPATKTGQSSGTGLGLSVTYGIIQEHAGKIRVDSKPGRGTTFTMEFPMVRKAVNA